MPTAQQNSTAIKASLFAALMAGADTGNSCEAEAVNKFRALRRMAANAGLRIVDVLEMPEVKTAIDQQMRPVRQKNGDLQQALEQAAALREELTERTRNVRELAELLTKREEIAEGLREELTERTSDVRKLTELLRRQEETATALREELAEAKCAAAQASTQPQQPQAGNAAACAAPVGVAGPVTHSFGSQSWVFEVVAVAVVLILIVMSAFHGQTVRGQNGTHKQGQRITAHGRSGHSAHRRSAGTAGRHITKARRSRKSR